MSVKVQTFCSIFGKCKTIHLWVRAFVLYCFASGSQFRGLKRVPYAVFYGLSNGFKIKALAVTAAELWLVKQF